MSEGIHPFRSAAFGGFNRQDVLNFLEKFEKEHTEKVALLTKERDDGQEGLASLQSRVTQLEQENTQVQAKVNELQESTERLQRGLDEKEAQLLATQEELRDLRAKVEELEPKATAYMHLKERASSIELDAHARAQLTIEKAKERSKKIQEESHRWVEGLKASYTQFQGNLVKSVEQSRRELELVSQMYERLDGDFKSHAQQLEQLLDRAGTVSLEEDPADNH